MTLFAAGCLIGGALGYVWGSFESKVRELFVGLSEELKKELDKH